MRLLTKLTSLSNFTRAKSIGGQIATLLILLMAIALILVMATVNVGNVAMDTTKLSNAADSAALMLGSNLATKSRMMYEGMGNTLEKCQKRNILSAIIAVVAAIIAVFFCQPCLAAIASIMSAVAGTTVAVTAAAVTVATGAVAGAVGGVVGAAISGTNIGQGALTGALAGAAVGAGGAAAGAGSAPAGTAFGTSTGASFGATTGAVGGAAAGAPIGVLSSTGAFLGATAGALGTASSLYNSYQAYEFVAKAQEQLAGYLGKLNEKDRYREGAFWVALQQVVDDPTLVNDDTDVDGDGDRSEKVLFLYQWWHKRLQEYASIVETQQPIIENFLSEMQAFRDYVAPTYSGTVLSDGTLTAGMLERQDYKWSMVPNADGSDAQETALPGPDPDNGIVDGSIVGLLRPLNAEGYTTAHWLPGPQASDMNAWMDEDCGWDTCDPGLVPAGYDDVDEIADDFRQMVSYMDALQPPTYEEFMQQYYPGVSTTSSLFGRRSSLLDAYRTEYDELVASANPTTSWETWIYDFIDLGNLNDENTYYYKLGEQIAMLQSLRADIVDIRDNRLPVCNEGNYDTSAPPVCIACGATTAPTCTYYFHPMFGWGCWWLNTCGGCVQNTPPICSFKNSSAMPHDTGTIDTNSNDEFLPVIADIDSLISNLTDFRDKILKFAQDMQGVGSTLLSGDLGGINPVTYSWEDARGNTTVTVQAGSFRLASTKTKKSFKKVCTRLVDYYSEYSSATDNCWIRVYKSAPSKNIGFLGRWNPFRRGVSKTSRAYYGIDSVGLKDTKTRTGWW